MALTASKTRVSLPWSRIKRDSIVSSSEVQAAITANFTRHEPQLQPQTSTLLALPQEIHERIYDFIFTPWSMVVLNAKDDTTFTHDKTVNLTKVGKRFLSGPPGFHLLLVSRDMYHSAKPRYGSKCTSKLYIGKVKGHSGRKLIQYLNSNSNLARWYPNIRNLYAGCALGEGRIGMNFRILFPNLMYAECTVHEGEYKPLLRDDDAVNAFLLGRHDIELRDWTHPTANHFLSVGGRAMVTLHRNARPWDDNNAAVVVNVLGTCAGKTMIAFGFTYRWEGDRVKVVSRIVREPNIMKFWEAGMERGRFKYTDIKDGEGDCPQRYQWVRAGKQGYL